MVFHEVRDNMIVCFIGHRKIENTETVKLKLIAVLTDLIKNGVTDFLFGSRSEFNSLCLETVTELKSEYPNLRRIYVRAIYPVISEEYKKYLLKFYEDTCFPKNIENAGAQSYVERNFYMIDRSDICVFYYNPDYKLPMKKETKHSVALHQPQSGTAVAYNYAVRKGKQIINLFSK